jgi:hypothetical protein
MEPIPQQINRSIDGLKYQRWAKWGFVGLFIVSGLIFVYDHFAGGGNMINEIESHVAAELPKAATVKKSFTVGPKQLEVYDRSDLLKKVPVPAGIAQNHQNQFTSAVDVPKMPYGGQAVSFTNISSGKSGIAVQANKRPLLGIGGKTKIGAIGGISNQGNIAIGYVSQDVVRVGPVNVGATPIVGAIGNKALFAVGAHVHGEF